MEYQKKPGEAKLFRNKDKVKESDADYQGYYLHDDGVTEEGKENIERNGATLGCVLHGRDGHTVYRGAEELFSHADPVIVRRMIRRVFAN